MSCISSAGIPSSFILAHSASSESLKLFCSFTTANLLLDSTSSLATSIWFSDAIMRATSAESRLAARTISSTCAAAFSTPASAATSRCSRPWLRNSACCRTFWMLSSKDPYSWSRSFSTSANCSSSATSFCRVVCELLPSSDSRKLALRSAIWSLARSFSSVCNSAISADTLDSGSDSFWFSAMYSSSSFLLLNARSFSSSTCRCRLRISFRLPPVMSL
mmetsp:Transcript_31738/g.43303  ORF Transcript_31738/g.43303 Transcript_31738/m.43303 type:complete len:219 (-) Transcript_31738:730-1386(-)